MKLGKLGKVFLLITTVFFGLFSAIKVYQKTGFNLYAETTEDIDVKIKKLNDLKIGYEGKASYHANQASRLQFNQGQLQIAKRHWNLAEENKKLAEITQKEIEKLEAKKGQMQKK